MGFTGEPICFKKLTKPIPKYRTEHKVFIHFGEREKKKKDTQHSTTHKTALENHFYEIESLSPNDSLLLSGMQQGLARTAPLDLSVNPLELCRLCLTQRSHCTIVYFFILFIYVFAEMRGATSMRENSHLGEAIRGL